jgi:hypothetical protein
LSGVNTHLFVIVSQTAVVHGTPWQTSGSFVGTQNPPRHARPLLPAHRFGAVQSEATEHVCIPPPSFVVMPPSVELPPVLDVFELELFDDGLVFVWLPVEECPPVPFDELLPPPVSPPSPMIFPSPMVPSGIAPSPVPPSPWMMLLEEFPPAHAAVAKAESSPKVGK